MKIREVTKKDFTEWVKLGILFLSKRTKSEITKKFNKILTSQKETSFICRTDDGSAIGFINVAIRNDYVEGSKTSPVGYLEGIYVKIGYRKKGVAKMLFKEAQKWFVKKRVSEIGSDAGVHNAISQKFHKSVGFKKYETQVHFIKKV